MKTFYFRGRIYLKGADTVGQVTRFFGEIPTSFSNLFLYVHTVAPVELYL